MANGNHTPSPAWRWPDKGPCGCTSIPYPNEPTVFREYVCDQHQAEGMKRIVDAINGRADEFDQLRRDRDELASALEAFVSRGHMKSPACTCAICESGRAVLARVKGR